MTSRTILITGANRGIGAGLLHAYLANGDSAIGTTRSADQTGPPWLQADMTDADSIAGLATRITGPLDVLICNAGVYLDNRQSLATGYAPDLWADSFAVNVTGVFLTIQALLPRLRAAKGKIAIISSQMGSDTRASGGSYIYRASKAAVLNLGRNLAVDLKSQGIAVGIYHPGWVRTDMGGSGAELDLDEAVQGLTARFEALSLATTGVFECWDGSTHPF